MIKGLLFDYGGTIDTNGCHWAEVLWAAYEEEKIPVSKEQFREAYVFGERTLARQPLIRPNHNFKDVLAIKCRLQADYLIEHGFLTDSLFKEKIEDQVVESCYKFAKRTTAQAAKTLEKLAIKYPMVLVSNFYGNVEAVLTDFGLAKFFPTIIESAVVGVRKPDPKIFELGVEALGFAPNECMVIGDSLTKDIVPAQAIGCQTIWIRGKSWDETDANDELLANSNNVIANFNELTQYLGE